MLSKLTYGSLKLPTLYIAQNTKDISLAKQKGIPYVVWNKSKEELLKYLLRPTLEQLFPYLDWDNILGPKKKFKTKINIIKNTSNTSLEEVFNCKEKKVIDNSGYKESEESDITTNARYFNGTSNIEVIQQDINTYIGDISSNVDIEVLQSLRLLPQFLGDIVDCIKINIGNGTKWHEGYNKKLGVCVGRYNAKPVKRNLIILDISGSIPRGISATMLTLLSTMREQLFADVIVTGGQSFFYSYEDKLPTPQKLRDKIGYGNEAVMFQKILKDNISNKQWGHIFSFGDNDSPIYFTGFSNSYETFLSEATVEHVHHYHTHSSNTQTGYAKFCNYLINKPIESFNTDWCNVITK